MNKIIISHKEPIKKGWSNDIKFCAYDNLNNKYFYRLTSLEQYKKKKLEFFYLKQVEKLGVLISSALEFNTCDEGVYTIFKWIDGVDAEQYITNLDEKAQYQYGLKAGKYLKLIHSLKAPDNIENWETRFNKKINRKIKQYEECEKKLDKGDLFIDYINKHRYLLKNRPNTFQHGDYHIGNMMIDNNKNLVIIDFDRYDFGDPWEEFNRIVWSAQVAPYFSTGLINGYFDDKVPIYFWKLLIVYISSNTLSSIAWAVSYGQEQINVMIKQADEVLSWYDDLKVDIPKWYKGKIY